MITQRFSSDYYGDINYEAIGIYSPRKILDFFDDQEKSLNFAFNWSEKYHPRHFFGSFSFISFVEKENFSDCVFLIPTERANVNWVNENNDIAKKLRSKKLPISISDKKVEKWQNSMDRSLILPDYFLKATSIDDLKERWAIENRKL